MAARGPNVGGGPMAEMSGARAPRPMRVTTAAASARPGDEPLTVDPADVAVEDKNAIIGSVGVVDRDGRRGVEVVVDGWRFELLVEDEARATLRDRASRDRTSSSAAGGPLEIRAIIPGRIVAVAVATGDTVEAGQTLLAVEAMKMQNELRAPRAGTVTRVPAGAGATVEVGDVLVVLG
jgi:biotin carboxyl carrier protein